ncbi:fucose permease [Rhodococcus wratislaviensis]|uniref:Major facilitator transporter n=1 Tax=Rhodococcus wratislaviensis TaxID=44752 RepID=A0AB38F877_RHOWR|nr:MFS transporter [Rhodococcus wratislaviensis]REE76624.1 fucose permease [Rhodococcus wratislaviensis]SPZ35941.1 major facilitator transporter [Rhodococcus wratislaviensis]
MAEPLRRARAGTFGIFGINGFLLGMWVVHIPAIEDRTGISHSTLGSLLLLLAVGAIGGMQVSGPLADRFGSRRMVIIAGLVLSAATVGPGLASAAWQLGLALLVFGFANGALDVSMNSQAVEVEQRYGRPIMSAFHALFSVGGVAGSLLGAATLAAGWAPLTALLTAAVVGVVAVAAGSRWLMADRPRSRHEIAPAEKAQGRLSTRVLALGGIAFMLMLSEGVANDWSTLQVKEHLGTSDSVAALAFGAFSVMMTVGRFTADRVSGALGPVAVVRYGTLIAALGMLLVVVSGLLPLTVLGWALFGLGLSGCVPQIFTAAGNLGAGSAGTNMSRVVGLGYVGFLAGPATIGWITQVVPLTVAMVVPLVCVLVAATFAGAVRRT